MMSSHEGLFADGRGLSDLLQGVTLEIFGEGESMGPLTEDMRAEMMQQESDIKYDVTWHSLKEGLEPWWRMASRPTSRPSSVPQPHGSTYSDGPIARPPPPNLIGCAR